MKYRLGIDLGTSSLGLAAYELDENDNIKNLAYIDEVIFREPINPKDFTTLNSSRRSKRLARRQHARYVKRIKKVIHVLKLLGVTKQDMQKLEKRDVFELRVRSLHEKITIPEFAKVVLHIAKHRGYKGDLSEGNKVSSYIEETKNLMNEKTLSEVWLERKKEAEKNGDSWMKISESGTFIRRDDVIKEFYRIFDKQAEFHSELNKIFSITNENFFPDLIGKKEATYREMLFSAIFYQRPIIWHPDKRLGDCRFEDGEKRASTAQTAFQKYRIAKALKDLRLINKKTKEERSLTLEERQKSFEDICNSIEQYTKKSGCLSKTILLAKLNIDDELYRTNLLTLENVSSNGMKCLTTEKVFYELNLLTDWQRLSELQQEIVIEFLSNITKYSDIYDNSDENVKTQLKSLTGHIHHQEHELDIDSAFEFINYLKAKDVFCNSDFKFEHDRSSYSLKALKKITAALLNSDKEEYDIIQELYPKAREKTYSLRSADEVKIDNPVIDRALVQLERSLKFAIQKLGGNPYEIVIELSREMKQSLAKRQEIKNRNTNTEKEKLKAIQELNNQGIIATSNNIEKQLLWQELQEFNGGCCPYCGLKLECKNVFSGGVQIDHIIPQGEGGENIYSNKVLCCAECNLEKGKRTPYLWSKAGGRINFPYMIEKFVKKLEDVAKTNKPEPKHPDTVDIYHRFKTLNAKIMNLKTKKSLDKLKDDFVERQNAQTAWIGRIVLEWTKDICDNVSVSQGQLTAYLRQELRLATLLPEIRIAEGKDIYNSDNKIIDKNLWLKLFKKHLTLQNLDDSDSNDKKIKAAFEVYRQYRQNETSNPADTEELFNDFCRYMLNRSENLYNKRCDHRHHIVDACVIGLCSRSLVQRANTWTGEKGDLRIINSRTGEKQKFPIGKLTDFSLRNELKKRLMNYVVWHKPDHYPSGNLFDETAYNVKFYGDDKFGFVKRAKIKDVLAKGKDYIEKYVYGKQMKQLLLSALENKEDKIYCYGNEVKQVKVFYKEKNLITYDENIDKKLAIANNNNPDKPHVKFYQNAGYACCDFDKKTGARIGLIPQHVYEKIKNQPVPDNIIRVFINDIVYDRKTKLFYVVKSYINRDGLQTREVTTATLGNLKGFSNFKSLIMIKTRQDIAKIKKGQF